MAASLGELFVELGVFADTKELHDFENKLKKINKTMQDTGKKNKQLTQNVLGLVKTLAGVATAITGAIYALNKLTNSLVQSNQEFLNLTRTSDISLGVFQKWNNIGRMLGVKNAAQQIEGLNQRLFELMLTGEGARGFQLAGINPIGQGAEGVLEQLRGRVSGMSDTSASYLLKQLGLDPTMLHLLRMGKDEFEALGQTIKKYQLTPEQVKNVQRMNVQLQIAQIKLQYLKDRAVMAIMPYFTRFIESLARVTEFLTTTKAGTILLAAAITGTLIPALIKLFTILATHPVVATIMAIAGALYLLIDDIMTYMQGGDSIIGLVINFLEDLTARLREISHLAASPLLEQLNRLFGLLNMNKSLVGQAAYDSGNFVTPQSRAISSVTNNTDNRQINQNVTISTNQPARDIQNELSYANYTFA